LEAGIIGFEPASGVYTELQCGMDADYGRSLDRDGAPTNAFEPSLFVRATVMSRRNEDRAFKAVIRSKYWARRHYAGAVTGAARAASVETLV
jgi:hypothetical protein